MTSAVARVVDVDPVADRDGWLSWRRGGVGASDVAGILGISRWSSPWSVWADKLGLLPEQEVTEPMEAGHFLEAAISPWFTARSGLHVAGQQLALERVDDPICRCTVDGFVFESPQTGGALDLMIALGDFEVKVVGPSKRWEDIPPDYQAQGQWQMYVTGQERVFFAVLMGRRLDIHEFDRNDNDIDFMVGRVHGFWSDHVVTGTPPATDGHDATLRAISAVYPEHVEDKSVDIDHLADTIAEWRAAKADEKAAERRKKAAAAEIEAALGDAEEGVIDGQRVVSWRQQTRKAYEVPEATFRTLRDVTANKKKKAEVAA